MVCGLSCSEVCGIFPDEGSNLCLLHWQMDYLLLSRQENTRLCFCHTCAVFLGKQGGDMIWTEAWKSRYHFFFVGIERQDMGESIFVAVFMDLYWPITTCLRWVFCDLQPKESQLMRSGRWNLHGWMFYTQGSRGISLRKIISMRSGSQLNQSKEQKCWSHVG